jgi:hypothetical protein
MVVENSDGPVTITGGLNTAAGADVDLTTTLRTLIFYTTPGNWYNNQTWDMVTIWDIDDGVTLPYLRWQDE